MPKFANHINGANGVELQNVNLQNLLTAPGTPGVGGRIYFDSNSTAPGLATALPAKAGPRWHDGTNWFYILASASTNVAYTNVARDGSGNFSAGTITAALTGNASTATTLATARNFSISGSKGSASAVSFDGSANVVLALNTLTALPGDIALTTGNLIYGVAGVGSSVSPGTLSRSLFGAPTADIDWAGYKITGLGTPLASTDAVNKAYVDANRAGLASKPACDYAMTVGDFAGGYSATGSGTSHVLQLSTNSATVIDGSGTGSYPAIALGMRILVQGLTGGDQKNNGIYTVTQVGTVSVPLKLTRALDCSQGSTGADDYAMSQGTFTVVVNGTTFHSLQFAIGTPNPITLETTGIRWDQLNGLGEISATSPLSISGNTISLTTVPYSLGGTNATTAWTAGSVLFAGSTALAQDNANFYWDNSGKKLGIGVNSGLLSALDVRGEITAGNGTVQVVLTQTGGTSGIAGTASAHPFLLYSGGAEQWRITTAGILQAAAAQTIQTASGNLTLIAGGGGQVGLSSSTATPAYIQSSSTGPTYLAIIGGGATGQSAQTLLYEYGGILKWQVGKDSANNFIIYDAANGANVIASSAAGGTTLSAPLLGLNLTTLAGNSNITLTPNGTGQVVASGADTHNNFIVRGVSAANWLAVKNDLAGSAVWLDATGSAASTLIFASGGTECWRIGPSGALQSPVAQTIKTATGALTLATQDGSNILITPSFPGFVGVRTATPLCGFQVNGAYSGLTAGTFAPAPTAALIAAKTQAGANILNGVDGDTTAGGHLTLSTTTPSGITLNQYRGYKLWAGGGTYSGVIASNTATTGGTTTFTVVSWTGGTPNASGLTWIIDTYTPSLSGTDGAVSGSGPWVVTSTSVNAGVNQYAGFNFACSGVSGVITSNTATTSGSTTFTITTWSGTAPSGTGNSWTIDTVVDALQLDWTCNFFGPAVALTLGLKNNGAGNYTSRLISQISPYNTTATKLQLQTHSNTPGIWNAGLFMDDSGNIMLGGTAQLASSFLSVYGGLAFNGAQTIQTTSGALTLLAGSGGAITFNSASSTQLANFQNSASTATVVAISSGAASQAAILSFQDNATLYYQFKKTSSNLMNLQDSIANANILSCTSNGTTTLSAVNGALTLSTLANNGNVVFTPNGTGLISHSSIALFAGNGGLPAATSNNIYLAGGFASGTTGRLYIGDGTGNTFYISKRTGSATTDLFSFTDGGACNLGTVSTGTWQGSIVQPTYGGTGNAFFQVSGPATSIRTLTFPNADATMTRTISQDIGNNSLTQIDITHSWGHRDIVATIQQKSDNTVWVGDVSFPDDNTCRINFNFTPTTNQFRVTLVGK